MLLVYIKMATKEVQFERLIAPVHFFMHLSRRAYDKYRANKILLHARNIYAANSRVVELIQSAPELLPDELFNDAIELLNHYGIWMIQFDEFMANGSFQLKDEFVFYHIDDQSAFPRDAEQHFFEYYTLLKKEIKL